jgi:hypothetical protein
MEDEEEGLLFLMMTTLTCPKASSTLGSVVEVSSYEVEIELKEEKVYTNLNEEKESDAETWVVYTGATNHISGCCAAFTKLDTVVLDAMCFGGDSVALIEGHRIVVFMCKNGKS